ncbi:MULTISPECIES: multidrug transporter [unclassified Salinibacterium]|uniref:multidrug transporter n=1 Tax=unclassified Salinibacterium TaxID=2632331 RepID=UPI001CD767AD|nr:MULTISPECIES: multidrug transporter [unclassified Salinibacterium]
MTPQEILDPDERAEQLTAAPKAVPEDAAPRITLSEGSDGATRIDIADTAVVRPGGPDGDIRLEFEEDVEAYIEVDAGPDAD